MGKHRRDLVKSKQNDVEVVASDKSVIAQYKQNSLSDFGYRCPYDKLPCKRYDRVLDNGACFTYDRNGRLRFVCKRFVAPVGFVVPKQLSSEQMKDSTI
jgi:hypothetical protein